MRRIVCTAIVVALLAATAADARLAPGPTAAPATISAPTHGDAFLWLPAERRSPASLRGAMMERVGLRAMRFVAAPEPRVAVRRHPAVAGPPHRRLRCPPRRASSTSSDPAH